MNNLDKWIALKCVSIVEQLLVLVEDGTKKSFFKAYYSIPKIYFEDDYFYHSLEEFEDIDQYAWWNWHAAIMYDLRDKCLQINEKHKYI